MPSCSEYNSLAEILVNETNKVDAVICPYVSDMGTGMGFAVFALLFFMPVGFGLTLRVQHPGPIVVVAVLSAAIVTPTLPGMAAKILAVVLFFSIAGVSLIIYRRANNTL